MMVSVNAEGKSLALELVENGGCSGNSSEIVNVAPFHPVEIRNQPRRNAAIKERTKSEKSFASFFQQFPRDAMLEDYIRQKKEVPKPAKRRALRVIVKKIPMPVFCRRNAGQHRWNRAGTEPQHGAQRLAMRQYIRQKIAIFNILPAECINQHDHGHLF